jgi:hypothetical protein
VGHVRNVHVKDVTRSYSQWRTQGFFQGAFTPGIFFEGEESTNSVEDRGQRERGSGGGIAP